MNDQTGPNFLYLVLCLILVGSSLLARRLPIAASLKMAAAWVGIFGALYVLFLFRGEGQEIWRRITADISGDRGTVAGQTVRIPKASDGHFYVTGSLNGRDVRFMIDSGATVTAISTATATSAGIVSDGGPPVLVQTANGITRAQPAIAERLKIGSIERRGERVEISGFDDDMNLLGMSFLSKLHSWRVEGETLVLEP